MTDGQTFRVRFDRRNYDIMKFLRDHPGGVKTLNCYKGKSVEEAMERFEHTSSAYHMLNDFRISDSYNGGFKIDGQLVDHDLTGDVSVNARIITGRDSTRNEKELRFLEELEGRLDWSKPLLNQLDKIAEHYDTWVNTAVYRHCRLFENTFLESITYTPWYFVPAVWLPIILYLGCNQFFKHVICVDGCTNSLTVTRFSLQIIYGLFIWSFLEYSLHRWVFHLDPGKSLTMMKIHFLIHGLHHKVPFDDLRQVFPPVPGLALATILYIPVNIILDYPLIKLTGGIIGYLIYDMVHYYVHHGSPPDGTYLYEMKRYHSNHHFLNHDKAYGISSKIWDHVFRTFVNVRELGFSLHW